MLDVINSIILGSLNPEKKDPRGNDYYDPQVRETQELEPIESPAYKVVFIAPIVSQKVEYYRRLIINDVVNCINREESELESETDQVIMYHRMTLERNINKLIREDRSIIDKGKYYLAGLTSRNADYSLHINYYECDYIFNFIIPELVFCYMEFQNHFHLNIDTTRLREIEYFYHQVLQRPIPEASYVQVISEVDIEPIDSHVEVEKKSSQQSENNSFLYKKINTNPEAIHNLYDSLAKRNRFISPDTKLTEFKKAFCGKKVTKPIVWTACPTYLYYFIKYICHTMNYVEYPKLEQWKTACACFTPDKEPFRFEPARLKNLRDPSSEQVKNVIRTAADNLK